VESLQILFQVCSFSEGRAGSILNFYDSFKWSGIFRNPEIMTQSLDSY